MIQMPSNWNRDASGDEMVIVADLQALADLGLERTPPVSFAYEAVSWGTHVADWEEAFRLVELVNRPNFGLCMDSYHVLSRIWADPRSPSGVRPGASAAVRASLARSLQTPRDKVMYVRLSDAEKLSPALLQAIWRIARTKRRRSLGVLLAVFSPSRASAGRIFR